MSEPQPKYTTAIIAAVPATDDPVNDHVIEDAHVTLQFLGEADALSAEQVEEIQASLELMASNLYPFPADVAGTAELGPDKAKVLLVQSEPLTKIRELMGTIPAVSTAVAASTQFPNWIPHLTLAYGDDGSQVENPGVESVTIGSLELWLADEHHAYPLAKAAPTQIEEDMVTASVSVVAAGLKTFDSNLHPRGRDGRFIEKFGVIKYLTSTGWAYGKVDGIYADEDSGETKLTITPSDLSGKPSGADSIVMVPKQVYRAPKPKAHLSTAAPGAKKIGGQGGSNPGGLYELPPVAPGAGAQPEKYYVKKPKTQNHGKNEALANAFYEEAGVPVPEVDLHGDGNLYSKIVEGQQDMASQLNNPEWTDQVRRNFAVDAWLSNRDVFGLTYDNMMTDPDGVPWRIDNGGALLYRAMGEKKSDFGSEVTELEVFRSGKKAKIFGPGMTKAQEIDGAERVLAILPSRIDDLVSEHGLPKSLADTLKARRQYIANYYGLPLPETLKAPEAQEGSSAPKVDPADIATSNGKGRVWFKNTLSSASFILQEGDLVEFPDGSSALYGMSEDGNQTPLSILGTQQQLLGWQQKHGGDAAVMVKKVLDTDVNRPDHDAKIAGADLTKQRWRRGDKIVSASGEDYRILGWNDHTGAVLAQHGDNPVTLLDTFGNDSTGIWTVKRWDPPAAEKLEEVVPPTSTLTDALNEMQGPATPEVVDDLANFTIAGEPIQTPETPAPAPGKTGQAAVAEAAIKADLDQPLPSGNGAPAPAKTQAPGGAKTMVLGDNTEAATGDEVVSKKDGKTYVFVKPKGQYAVVTDPNGDDPQKQLLKLASTMTQPGKAPATDVGDVAAPKTATGEVPSIGMMAVAKDGWAGEITLISPDGKFVFITDANGKRKRKSTGTVSITSAPAQPGPVDTEQAGAPSPLPGPVKTYGPPPESAEAKEVVGALDWDDPADLGPEDMIVVGYADGSIGLEPYTGQPVEQLLTNTSGKLATHNTIKVYKGPISGEQMVKSTAATGNDTIYEVIWNGTYGYTDGSTGPSGGLMIWGVENGAPDLNYAFELPPTGQVLSVVDSDPGSNPLVLPTGVGLDAWDGSEGGIYNVPLPVLYSDEAKTLKGWQGQLAQGSQISLDGDNWLTVTHAYPTGALDVKDLNGSQTTLLASSLATYVVKAPEMSNGDAISEKFSAEPMPQVIPAVDITDEASAPQLKLADGVKGDVVLIPGGLGIEIIDHVEESANEEFNLVTFGAPDGEHVTGTMTAEKLGNIYDGPVVVPAGLVAPKLYPGVILQPNADTKLTVVTYPGMKGDGGFQLAVMHNDDPENVSLLKIGGEGSDLGEGAVLPVHFAQQTHANALGVDTAKVDALFNAAVLKPDNPVDHHWEMNAAGLDFGKAKYPIYVSTNDAGQHDYLRNGPSGPEYWDHEDSQWVPAATGSTIGLEKVWDGVPHEGTLTIPEGLPQDIFLNSGGDILSYQPEPGEVVEAAQVKNIGGISTVLVAYPGGSTDGPGYAIMHSTNGEAPHKSSSPFAANWKELPDFSGFTTIHDPFADAPAHPEITHHTGMAPTDLMLRMTELGHTPQAGTTYLAVVTPASQMAVMVKQPDGSYKQLMMGGSTGVKTWSLAEIQDPAASGSGSTFYTWTATSPDVPEGNPVEGMPASHAPFVPSAGQAVVKQTLSNGKETVYVQNSPGSGWYLLGPDGTVDESSDAIKSDHVVQQKLQGKGSPNVKLELLHPKSEGETKPGDAVPTFKNNQGEWTPQPGQKVVGLYSDPNDTDPWFYVQNAPGEKWEPAPITPAKSGMDDTVMQHALSTKGSAYKLVFDGTPAVDTDAAPSFFHHTPKPGTAVYKDDIGDLWGQHEPGGKYHWIKPDGGYSDGSLSQEDLDTDPTMQLVWPNAQPTAATVPSDQEKGTFAGYTPVPGNTIISYNSPHGDGLIYLVKKTPGSGNWFEIHPSTGKPGTIPIYDSEIPNNLGPEYGNDYAHVWPPQDAPAAAPAAPAPTFKGYTPQPGEKVVGIPGSTSSYWVQKPGGNWFSVKSNGTTESDSLGITDDQIQNYLGNGNMEMVWDGGDAPAAGPAGVFAGYQSLAGENVITVSGVNLSMTMVKKDDGNWYEIKDGSPQMASPFSQGAIDWLGSDEGGATVAVLQGSLKDDTAPEPLDTSVGKHAGVAAPTTVTTGSYTLEGNVEISAYAQEKINGLELQPGQSLWIGGNQPYMRSTTGQYFEVYGGVAHWQAAFESDDEFEKVFSADYPAYKVLFTAPQAAPAAPAGPAPGSLAAKIPVSGWQQHQLPDPGTFGHAGAGGEALVGTPAGTWVFMPNPVNPSKGVFVKLAQDHTVATAPLKIDTWVLVKDGVATEKKHPTLGQEWIPLGVSTSADVYVQGHTPVPTPAAPAAAPAAPSLPSYPGAQLPAQEDINAWGGKLTKDGYIPTAGMFVTGKGPMTGKIISVSKDKTKAVVLTSDGKKTTRLIEALKTDKSANYSAYAAPVALKDIPQGMPLAVDTVAEALDKTPKDGKFRAILTAHPGVSHGQITVTRATGPSGKVYSRIHLNLTTAQREQLTAMLAGTAGEKGDWVTSTKMSDAVSAGDLLPMRKSSTNNPDGSPRWKVDSTVKPPTHEVVGVTDDPAGGGIKLVTMKDRQTGEEITSRFHPGKSLTTYTWDANKPKPVIAGTFALNETAQLQGWQYVTDGGSSAATGGAQNAQLKVEPGQTVPTSASVLGQVKHSWQTLRNVSADGVIIETLDPKGSTKNSTTGTTIISVPEGLDETALGAAFSKLGIDYSPMTQDSAKDNVRGILRNLLQLDMTDIDTAKGWTDDKLFSESGKVMGISDLGWTDVLVGVDESTGKTSFFWSDRARNALAAKAKYNVVYRAASSANAPQIVSTVKYGSASSILKKTTGMLDGSGGTGAGASADTDNANHAHHGSYASATKEHKLPTSNPNAHYKSVGMMIYHRPEAVLGRIMDYRTHDVKDAFGAGYGQGANHLDYATKLSKVKDYFLGDGLPTEAVGFVAVSSAEERTKAIAQLKADGYEMINGRPVEEIIITKQKAATLTPDDLPPVTIPANARPILDLPTSYDAPAAPAVTASGEDEQDATIPTQVEEAEVA